ncbi:MAG: hypothetical protein RBT51_14855 [Ectothiorhodospiraceae bacterium]|jgi:hypothetical protein|nr:hypothetical protein [Ectothiorhodospiraceae bacterium]
MTDSHSDSQHIPNVGAQDPELHNSPIALESDEDYDVLQQEVTGEALCYFNGVGYPNGAQVMSGEMLLVCDHGVWERVSGIDDVS